MGMMDRIVEWNRLESRPYVKELTDTERLDFLDEYCGEIRLSSHYSEGHGNL